MPTTDTTLSSHAPLASTPTGEYLRLHVTKADNQATTQIRLDVRLERPQVRTATSTST